jgi:dynein heavy chain
MTEYYITPPLSNMNVLYQDLSNFIPMIFVLSKGADPTSTVLKFANDMGITSDKLLSISLGQG